MSTLSKTVPVSSPALTFPWEYQGSIDLWVLRHTFNASISMKQLYMGIYSDFLIRCTLLLSISKVFEPISSSLWILWRCVKEETRVNLHLPIHRYRRQTFSTHSCEEPKLKQCHALYTDGDSSWFASTFSGIGGIRSPIFINSTNTVLMIHSAHGTKLN